MNTFCVYTGEYEQMNKTCIKQGEECCYEYNESFYYQKMCINQETRKLKCCNGLTCSYLGYCCAQPGAKCSRYNIDCCNDNLCDTLCIDGICKGGYWCD